MGANSNWFKNIFKSKKHEVDCKTYSEVFGDEDPKKVLKSNDVYEAMYENEIRCHKDINDVVNHLL